jgi:hypothetical protein
VRPGDPRADPTVVDLVELAGLWLAAGDWPALSRCLRQLDRELTDRFGADDDFAARFRAVLRLAEGPSPDAEEVRRAYRRASVG